jgi:membrane-associated phospholipid phosphatase
MSTPLAALLLIVLTGSGRADEGTASPTVDWTVDGAITGGMLALWGVSELASGTLSPPRCRWCGTPGLDADVRNALAWSNKGTAAFASNVLVLSVPAGIAMYGVLAARAAGDVKTVPADLLLVGEAVAISGVLTQAAKYATARQRPYAYFGTGYNGRDGHASFWSGHTSFAFSAAAAGGTVARLRGYAGWPWVYGVGFTAAAATGYLRVAADKHWLTDVLAAAVSGTAVGLAVPLLHRAVPRRMRVVLVPGGIALAGDLEN